MFVLAASAQDCGAETGRGRGCGQGRGSHETDSQASEKEKSGKEEAEKEGGERLSLLLSYEKGVVGGGVVWLRGRMGPDLEGSRWGRGRA